MDTTFTLVVAMSSPDRVIGMGGSIPWLGKLPADMKHFRALTVGKSVIMGRKTFLSIGHPLPERHNIVLTKNAGWSAEGAETARDVHEVFSLLRGHAHTEAMVIGGAEIYHLFLPLAKKVEATMIQGVFNGDTYFPELNAKDWDLVASQKHPADEQNLFPYSFDTFVKIP